MRFTFIGKNIAASDAMKERTTKKIERLAKLLPPTADVTVTFTVVKQDNTVEVSIPLGRRTLRAQVTKPDWFAAIDEIVDILERQMVKFKKRAKDKSRRDGSFKTDMAPFLDNGNRTDEEIAVQAEIEAEIEAKLEAVSVADRIERVKTFALKPMDEEEAIMEMELLGHVFFVFRNSKNNDVNVVYKRKDGAYGLICPE